MPLKLKDIRDIIEMSGRIVFHDYNKMTSFSPTVKDFTIYEDSYVTKISPIDRELQISLKDKQD